VIEVKIYLKGKRSIAISETMYQSNRPTIIYQQYTAIVWTDLSC